MFQSTRPVKDATPNIKTIPTQRKFQSTRPVKDATLLMGDIGAAIVVSIHASREGRDRLVDDVKVVRIGFQSTRPVKDATSPLG